MITFALLALIACVGISCVPIYLLGRGVFARAREYFVASEHTPSGVIQNSSIAYSLQIATFGQFFAWGAKGEFWPAMIFSAMFGAGLYLIYRLRLPMRAFMSQALERDRSVTVPGFIARQHGNDARVQLIAATLSVCAFAGLIASAAIGAASLVRPILPGSLNTTFPIACGLLGLMLLYTIPAGNSGAMRSAQALLGILYLGLIGSILIVLYMLISSAGQMPPQGMFAVTVLATCCAIVLVHRHQQYINTSPIRSPVSGEANDIRPLGARLFRRFSWIVNVLIAVLAAITLVFALIGLYAQGVTAVITESLSALRAETRTSISGLLALVLLPIFYPIVDTTNWLRITALQIDPPSGRVDTGRIPETFARVLAMYASASALVWLLICMFGTVGVLATNTPSGGDVLQSFIARLASQQNDLPDAASGLLLVSVTAMAVVTSSAMFSAILAIIRYDIVPIAWSNLAPERAQPSNQALARRCAVIAGSSLCVVMLIAWFVLNDNPALSLTNGRFLSLQLACLCAQLAFGPLVLGPLISGNSAAISPAWAIAVIGAGVGVGQGVTIVSLQPEHAAWLWSAIPACLGSGLSLYAVARLWTGKPALEP
jgi:NADH:ubiquinone oxidoreductase subunit 6 (subunit J)